MADIVEVRCPVGFQRLFTRMRLGQIEHRYVQPGNWIEFACEDCARQLERDPGTRPRVRHRYNFAGELVETVTELRTTNPSSD